MNRAVGNWMQQKNLSGIIRGSSESLLPFLITRSCRDHGTLNCGPGKSHRSFLVSAFPIVFMVLSGWCLDRRENLSILVVITYKMTLQQISRSRIFSLQSSIINS